MLLIMNMKMKWCVYFLCMSSSLVIMLFNQPISKKHWVKDPLVTEEYRADFRSSKEGIQIVNIKRVEMHVQSSKIWQALVNQRDHSFNSWKCSATCDTAEASWLGIWDLSYPPSFSNPSPTNYHFSSIWTDFYAKNLSASFGEVEIVSKDFLEPKPLDFSFVCFYPIYPTPPLGQDVTQGQFLSGV